MNNKSKILIVDDDTEYLKRFLYPRPSIKSEGGFTPFYKRLALTKVGGRFRKPRGI